MTDLAARLLPHLAAVTAFVRRETGDAELAADVVQEALVKALAHAGGLRDDERLVAWFWRIVRNTIADVRRSAARRERDVSIEEGEGAAAVPDEEQRALCACLEPLIEALPADQRDALRAVDLDGESPASTAARLGVTLGNLNVRRHRARRRLADDLRATCRLCAEHGCLDCSCRT